MKFTLSRQLCLLGFGGLFLLLAAWANAQSPSTAPAITVYADPT